MPVKDDILKLKVIQDDLKVADGKYTQILPTAGTDAKFKVEKDKAGKDKLDINTDITEKDYTYRVDVWTRKHLEEPETSGFVVTAERDLGDGVIERVILNETIK